MSKPLELLLELGVSRQVAEDWLAIRRAKRAPLTKTAACALQREASLAGLSVEDAVRTSVERGWAGFKASWLHGESQWPQSRLSSAGQATAQAAQEFLRKLNGDADEPAH